MANPRLDIDVLDGTVSVRVGEEYAAQVVDLPIPASPPDPPTLYFGVLGATDEHACDVWFDDIYAY